MNINMQEILKKTEEKMKKSVSRLVDEYASIRGGRANPAILDKVTVNYYNTPTAINQLAAISVSEASVLLIQPWDVSICREIEKAIQTSDIGINFQNDGQVIRLHFPPLTEDRRREIVKELSKMSEENKIAVRGVRRNAIDILKARKKEADLSEDELKNGEKQVQDLTDKYCKKIDQIFADKQKEIMEV